MPPYEERITGPTPNGGAYAIAYFEDRDHNPVTKDQAVRAEVIEFDSNEQEIMRFYMEKKSA